MPNSTVKTIILWTFAFFSALSSAAVVLPNDGPYYQIRTRGPNGNALYIYDETARDEIEKIISHDEAVRKNYELSYGWKLDEEMNLVLTSPAQQEANGYATVIPNLKTVWYPSGGRLLSDLSANSWGLQLSAHETAHLYQLNAKGPLNAGLKKVFGNPFYMFAFGVPFFIHPNVLTPNFLVEGNATMMESRLNIGGRLHSGEVRALVLAQIRQDEIDTNRLINDQFRFPFGTMAYQQGAYFQAFLVEKYGLDKVNQFFLAQGRETVFPLVLNMTFRSHFGSSYNQEIREFVRHWKNRANSQKVLEGPTLYSALFIHPLNHDHQSIFWLGDPGVSLRQLVSFDKKTRALKTEPLDLLSGKVFFSPQGEPETSSAAHVSVTSLVSSLYGEGAKINPQFANQIVIDQRAGQTVALSPSRSWINYQILVNGTPYDLSQSEPILDDQGGIYYFRQSGNQRVLYRNRTPLFKFTGFFAKPLEVTTDGSFYFIGNTELGSSLFRFKDNEVTQVLDSDLVVDARALGNGEFLAVEVNVDGYSLKLAKAKYLTRNPAHYSYALPPAEFRTDEVSRSEILKLERPYGSLRELRYSDATATFGSSSGNGGFFGLTANFTDPLEYHDLNLSFLASNKASRGASFAYSFTKYRPSLLASYAFVDDFIRGVNRTTRAFNQEGLLGVTLPLVKTGRWTAAASTALAYSNKDRTPFLSLGNTETYGNRIKASLSYLIPTFVGFYPWRLLDVSFENRLESKPNQFEKLFNTSIARLNGTWGFAHEFFVKVSGAAAWSESPDVQVRFNSSPVLQDIYMPRFNSSASLYTAQRTQLARMEIAKVINARFYSPRIPVGLDRMSLLLAGQQIWSQNIVGSQASASHTEYGLGFDVQLKIAHKLPTVFRYFVYVDPQDFRNSTSEVILSYRSQF